MRHKPGGFHRLLTQKIRRSHQVRCERHCGRVEQRSHANRARTMLDKEKARQLWPSTSHGRWMSEEYVPGLVSVIIPTYNRARLVTEAMDSVLAQTYRPIELVVVDDGSTDDTPGVLEEWGKRHAGDPQFEPRTFHQENRGVSAARNLGLIESHGEFIQFVDSDDLLMPDKLACAVERMDSWQETDIVYSLRSDLDCATGKTSVAAQGNIAENTTPGEVAVNGLQTMVPVFRRNVLVATGPWNEGLWPFEDWEYNTRAMLFVRKAFHVNKVQAIRRAHNYARLTRGPRYRKTDQESRQKAIMSVCRAVMASGCPEGKALRVLGNNYLCCVRATCVAGFPQLARAFLNAGPEVWRHAAGGRARATGWYAVTLLPGWACRGLLRPLADLKALVRALFCRDRR